jgi:hypothetical protein
MRGRLRKSPAKGLIPIAKVNPAPSLNLLTSSNLCYPLQILVPEVIH